jgi:hypothetical protein
MVKSSACLISLCWGCSRHKADPVAVGATKTPELYFFTRPSKQLFWMGEPVEIGLELYSRLEQPILVSRLQDNNFVNFKVVGPDDNEVQWQGKAQNGTRAYSYSDFTVLGQYKAISANRIISLKDGTGFAFDKPGQYSLIAEYSIGNPEDFASFGDQAKPAVGSFRSSKLVFCIEASILKPVLVRNNAPQSALEAVLLFYTDITKYPQLGIPYGRAKKTLWPRLSKRLAQELDGLGACDKDYYRRYGKILRAQTLKPATPWLEEGLFTGPNDAATPSTFRILGSRSVGENRVDVLVAFKEDWGDSEGDVTAILENNRWVIDDYIAMYANDELRRLSAGYSECKDGRWVGESAY